MTIPTLIMMLTITALSLLYWFIRFLFAQEYIRRLEEDRNYDNEIIIDLQKRLKDNNLDDSIG